MNKQITIAYSVNNEAVNIPLYYTVSVSDNVHTIACNVNLSAFHAPAWLQLRKFEIRSILIGKNYSQLFSDDQQARNFDSVLFVDKAYGEIMKMEHTKVE